MVNIVFITHYNSMNGANQSLLALIKYVRQFVNIEVVMIYGAVVKEEGLYKELTDLGIHAEFVDLKYFLYYSNKYLGIFTIPFKIWHNIKPWKRIVSRLKTTRIDIVYSNSSMENSGLLLAAMLKAKHVWHIREFGYKDYGYRHIGFDWAKRKVLKRSDQLIAISHSIFDYINLPEKTKLIYNGVFSVEELKTLSISNEIGGVINLGVVGLISRTKNQKEAIELMKLLDNKNISLHIYGAVGEQDYYKELQEYIDKNRLERRVVFKGFVKDREKLYSEINVLLMCSRNEAFGRVTVEAMAFGIPVVGYNGAGTSELIADGVNGLLYDGTSKSIYQAVASLIDDNDRYRQLAGAAKKSAYQYSIENYGESVLKLIGV